jgi:hypothetical protein
MLLLMLKRQDFVAFFYCAKYSLDPFPNMDPELQKIVYGSTALLGRVPLGIPTAPRDINKFYNSFDFYNQMTGMV